MNRMKAEGKRKQRDQRTGVTKRHMLFSSLCLLPLAICLSSPGCAHPQTRLQADDEADPGKEAKEVEIRTIGDAVSFSNADPVPVSGVGLVVGLEGTGGGAPPGTLRQRLEDQLRKRGIESVKEVLASKDASLVLVSAVVPPGARKGDALDVEITVPRESKTTSLQGGRLLECELYNYDTVKHLNPKYAGSDRYVMGHPIAKAEGPLLVGFGDGDEEGKLRQARIWSGGRCRIDRPIYVVLNVDKQSARLAQVIADRINQAFHGSLRGPMTDLAVAETKQIVYLKVPSQYRLNLPRYLRVVRLIPLQESEASQIAYHRRLEEQLLDPAHTVTASLRLEALGQESIRTLKRGLVSESPLVRFCAAEALAYLGSPSCGEELARTVEQQPVLRAFSLTALASLDEAVCHVELRRLLSSASPETRYGAFRALRALDEHDEAVQGELLNDSFWLHRVAPGSTPLVHLSTVKRAEIVLFGEDACLVPPFPIVAGEFTLTAKQGDERGTVTRISLRHGKNKRQCSLKLEEVLQALADMGAGYAEVVEVLRRADSLQCLNCRVAVDALPQATSVYDLAKAGAGDPELQKTHPEILAAKADFSATPTLFQDAGRGSSRCVYGMEEETATKAHDSKTSTRKNGKTAQDVFE